MEDSDFITNLRDSRNYTIEENDRKQKINNDWDELEKSFIEGYKQYNSNNGGKKVSDDEARAAMRDFVKKAAVADGKISQKDIDSGNYDEYTFREYGTKAIKNLFGEVGTDSLDDYIEKHGDDETKKYYKSINRERSVGENIGRAAAASTAASALTAMGPAAWIGGLLGFNAGRGQEEGKKKKLQELYNKYDKEHNEAVNNSYDAIINADKYLANKRPSESGGGSEDNGTTGEEVTFTLTRGNDPNYKGFGQKLVDLGLATNKGLWGADGDVEFYNKQLYDQGIYGNLPIGVPIKLKKRKV